MQSSRVVYAIGLVLVLCGALLSGCSGSATATAKCSKPGGCELQGSVTVTFATSCRAGADCKKEGGAVENFLARAGVWTSHALGISEAMASTFDASQMRVDISTTNVAITNSTGNFIVSLYDGSTLIAQNTFAYYRSGNSLYPTDPSAINSWVSGYSQYTQVQVSNTNYDLTYTPTTTATTTGTVGSAVVYQGTTQATATTSFSVNSSSSGCGSLTKCQQQ